MPLARALRGARRRHGDPATRSPARWPGCARSTRSTRRSGSAWSANRSTASRALILTASGGPFLDATPAELAPRHPGPGARHPTWTMGAKITIDSATLANKGLEVIEAHWLYDVDYDAIEVVIHPQSVVHSAVRFVDGSLKAQLGTPDMRLPIQYALTYPDRRPSPAARARPRRARPARLPGARRDALPGPPDRPRGGPPWARGRSAALIAADEVAVARFLDGTLDVHRHPARCSRPRSSGSAAAGPDARRRRPGRPRRRGPRDVRDRPLRSTSVTALFQSVVTIVLFILILGVARPHPRARPLRDRPARQRPRPRVRDRLPAARQGPGQRGETRLHAQLAADRRLREARRRGRRPTPTTRARSRRRSADQAADPRRRRR